MKNSILEGTDVVVSMRRGFPLTLVDDLTYSGHLTGNCRRQEADLMGGIGSENGSDGSEL
jgi:hypothetical protein